MQTLNERRIWILNAIVVIGICYLTIMGFVYANVISQFHELSLQKANWPDTQAYQQLYDDSVNQLITKYQTLGYFYPIPSVLNTNIYLKDSYSYLKFFGFIVLCLATILITKQPWKKYIPFTLQKNAFSWPIILSFFIFMGALYLITLPFPDPKSIFEQLNMRPSNPYPYIKCMFIMPVLEEIVFRGILYAVFYDIAFRLKLSSKYCLLSTIFLQAVFFATFHLQYDIFNISIILVMGVFFGIIRTITNSITPCIVMHSGSNMLTAILAIW